MLLKISMIVLLVLSTTAVFVGSPRVAPENVPLPFPPPQPEPSVLGQTRIKLSTVEKLGEGFKKIYDLNEVPDLFSISQIQMSATAPGESAKGVIVLEKSGELYLDSTPCEPNWDKKQVFSFNRPYAKEQADDQLCTNPTATYKTTKVIKN